MPATPLDKTRDDAELVRALRRAVYTHKLLSHEEARRYLSLLGLPESLLEATA